jgi:hypothetical protein
MFWVLLLQINCQNWQVNVAENFGYFGNWLICTFPLSRIWVSVAPDRMNFVVAIHLYVWKRLPKTRAIVMHNIRPVYLYIGARGSVVDSVTMLQDRKVARSIPDKVITFFNVPNPSNRTMALGSN